MKWLKRLPSGLGVFVAITLLAPLLALTVMAIKAASESPLESASTPEPLIGSVEAADRDKSVTVAIKVEFADALAPVTTAFGTVTAVNIAAGQTVSNGAVVATVNDLPVIAYSGATPLWRDIMKGQTGADVAVAQAFLAATGYYAGAVNGNAQYSTQQAIKAFNKANGFGATNPVLSLTSLAWIGPADVVVALPSVHQGDSASGSTELFTTTAALAAIVVTETANVVRDQPVTLTVLGVSTSYVQGSGRVTDPTFVAAVAAALGQTVDGTGSVALVTPIVVGQVPASAIVIDANGLTCIFPDLTGAPIAVTPGGGTPGTVDLDAALIGQAVLMNPREVREDLTCG